MWKLFQRSLAKTDIDDDAGGSVGGTEGKGFWLPLPQEGFPLSPSPQGTHWGRGEGVGTAGQGKGDGISAWPVSSASVPLWLLGVEGGSRNGEGGSRLVWLPLGSCSCLGPRILRDLGGVREPRELLTSPKRNTFFSFPIEGLIQGPLIEE